MTRILFSLMTSLLLAACGTTDQQQAIDRQKEIADFSNRAIVFAWFDDSGFLSGRDLRSFVMSSINEAQDPRRYSMAWEKMYDDGGGYLIWHAGFEPGLYRFHSLRTYDKITGVRERWSTLTFGSLIGLTSVSGPDVIFAGCYAIENTSGIFEPAKYMTRRSACGPSRQQMLANLLDYTSEFSDPHPAQRIREAMH